MDQTIRRAFAATVWILVTVASCVLDVHAADSSSYPDRRIRLVVGFGAGGNSDVVARLLASALSVPFKQPVFVENRPGAGGNIAADAVAKAKPDGYTLLLSSVGPLVVAPTMVPNLPYRPDTDFEPISLLTSSDLVLVVNATVGVRTLGEFTALAKLKPRTLTVASTGIGSAGHLAIELYTRSAGADVIHVPYRNAETISGDLLAGRVSGAFAPTARVLQHCVEGTLVALGTTGPTRSIPMPKVPTFIELGYPNVEVLDWYALLAPAGTPPGILDELNREVAKALNEPSTRSRLAKYGLDPIPSSRADLGRYLQKEALTWSTLLPTMAEHPP
jgi:tripartite-type tricarboxylate transporter receptor subunit TctC